MRRTTLGPLDPGYSIKSKGPKERPKFSHISRRGGGIVIDVRSLPTLLFPVSFRVNYCTVLCTLTLQAQCEAVTFGLCRNSWPSKKRKRKRNESHGNNRKKRRIIHDLVHHRQ